MTLAPAPPRVEAQAVLAASVALLRDGLAAGSVREVADVAGRLLADLVGADQGSIGLLEGGDIVTVSALIRQPAPIGSRFPVGFGVAGWVAAVGRAAEIEDVREDTRYVPLPYPEVRSFLGLPLAADGEVVGVASLSAWTPGAFPAGTAATLEPLLEQAARLLRKAAEDETTRTRLHALEHDVTAAVTEGLHELKSPLNALNGLLGMVAEEKAGPLAAQQRELLGLARDEAERLQRGLAELVEAAAFADRPARPRVEVDPFDLLVQTAGRFRGAVQGREVRLEVSGAPGEARVLAEPEAILQVLANLVQNALRVSPANGAVRLVSAVADDRVWLAVEDDGPGISAEQRERLFGRYEQAADAGHARGDVGLGLWIAGTIVGRHGGALEVTTTPRGGARLQFSLPIAGA
jgi:signal transduction histidine kinase